MSADDTTPWRADFDASVTFSNGGALQAVGFRLDIPGATIDDEALGELVVRHLGLLMVDKVVITRKEYVQQAHKGGRSLAPAPSHREVRDLGGAGTRAHLPDPAPGPLDLVDREVVVVRASDGDRLLDRAALLPFAVHGRAVLVRSGGDGLSEDAAAWLAGEGAAVVGTDEASLGPGGRVLERAGVPAVTALGDLDRVPPAGARLHVVPLGGASVLAYVVVEAGEADR